MAVTGRTCLWSPEEPGLLEWRLFDVGWSAWLLRLKLGSSATAVETPSPDAVSPVQTTKPTVVSGSWMTVISCRLEISSVSLEILQLLHCLSPTQIISVWAGWRTEWGRFALCVNSVLVPYGRCSVPQVRAGEEEGQLWDTPRTNLPHHWWMHALSQNLLENDPGAASLQTQRGDLKWRPDPQVYQVSDKDMMCFARVIPRFTYRWSFPSCQL